MTIEEAKAQGYVQLTVGYKLPKEKWMLDSVVRDAELNNRETALVNVPTGTEVWQRSKNKPTKQ